MRTRWLAAILGLVLTGCGGGATGTSGAVPPAAGAVGINVPIPTSTGSGSGSTASTVATTGTSTATPAPAGAPLAPTLSGSYGDAYGTFPYVAYVSSKAKHPFPLVIALHDCGTTPAAFESATRWFEDAEANGYAVVMPAHGSSATDPGGCWAYWSQHYRGRGEAATLAGLAQSVQLLDGADPRRTYVAGMSDGGAQALTLAADYPDVFAAAAAVAGTEYQPCIADERNACATALTTPNAAQPGSASGKAAFTQDPAWRRAVPAMLVQGDADTVVPPFNLQLALMSLATMDDGLTSGGSYPGAFTAAPSAPASGTATGGRSFDEYTAANGALDWIVVHGMGHEWPNGTTGPDATARFRAFFFAHAL